jgi:urease accessory protein
MVPSELLVLADGRLPAGGHAQSSGLESAVRLGDVVDLATLERFLAGRLATVGVTDAAFAAAACAAVQAVGHGMGSGGVAERLGLLAEELTARTPGPRSREIAARLGRQLQRTAGTLWPHPAFGPVTRAWPPLVLGVATAAAGGTPHVAASLTLHHLAASITTAAVRLLALDPVAVAALQVRAARSADRLLVDVDDWVRRRPADLPAAASSAADVLAEHHGTWPARLFVA